MRHKWEGVGGEGSQSDRTFNQRNFYRNFMDIKHIYFLGIAGIGVSALAQLAQARGVRVSGADPAADPKSVPAVARLLANGAGIYTVHTAANLAADVDLIVASAAVGGDNPELLTGRERGIRIVSRAEFLGELMEAHAGITIAVAGTHGKTTTTAMIGVMLQEAGLDPTVFVGGEVAQIGGNVRVGSPNGPFVAEACEAYDSFLHLKPDIAVLVNIEADHLDHYGDWEHVLDGFRRFVQNVKQNMIVCTDDPGIAQIEDDIVDHMPYRAYSVRGKVGGGWAENICLSLRPSFEYITGGIRVPLTLQVPGLHNVSNAVAAATVAWELIQESSHVVGDPYTEISVEALIKGLEQFQGAERRQEILGEAQNILVMDDYAHHPTEIRATLGALRGAYPERRLVAIFQPHLYSRTRDFMPEFAETLSAADALLVTDVYSARETQAQNPDVRAADIVNHAVAVRPDLTALYLPDRHDIPKMLAAMARPGDLTVFLGAGDIREQALDFLALLNQKIQGVAE